jgi:methylated-DNA-[protein]-cysteine S-methyltransferase
MTFYYQKIKSPAGPLVLAGTGEHLYAVVFEKQWPTVSKRFAVLEEAETKILKTAKQQLAEYFTGQRKSFDLPIKLGGTAFQNRTWSALAKIPFGQTRTYKQQAEAAASPKAVRAVGRTNGLNPLCIVLPCHRVIGSDGTLTGYAGGLEAKKFLLELEGGL